MHLFSEPRTQTSLLIATGLLLGSSAVYAADAAPLADAQAREPAAANFEKVDLNKDGALAWEEIRTAYDADGNARLERSEYAAFTAGSANEAPDDSVAAGDGAGINPADTELTVEDDDELSDSLTDAGIEDLTPDREQDSGTTFSDESQPVVSAPQLVDLPIEAIEERQVVNSKGKKIGDVEDVVVRTDGSEAGLVVGIGGSWDVGDKDVFVGLDHLRVEGDKIVWTTDLDQKTLESLPSYDQKQFVSVPSEA